MHAYTYVRMYAPLNACCIVSWPAFGVPADEELLRWAFPEDVW